MAFAVSCLGFSFTSATMFHLNVKEITAKDVEEVKKNIIPIHFADNWNDFGWFLYFSNGIAEYTGTSAVSEYKYTVSVGSTQYRCARQVKWFYYNAERWERLWPIDEYTWSGVDSIKTLDTVWGFFTRCESDEFLRAIAQCDTDAQGSTEFYDKCEQKARQDHEGDSYWYYWMITQTYPKGTDQKFFLAAWVDYDTTTKFTTIKTDALTPTFIRFWNKYPAGFIYDPNWGVGFVGCKVKPDVSWNPIREDSIKKILSHVVSPGYLDNIFKFEKNELTYLFNNDIGDVKVDCSDTVRDPLLWIVIEWIVWLGEDAGVSNLNIIWNEMDDKMQYFSTANINNSTLMNYAKKKAEIMCRWKWNCNTNDSIVCCETDPGISEWTERNPKTYIIRDRDVHITPKTSSGSNGYYDVFVMNGNLVINESNATKKFVFTTQGFVSDTSLSDFDTNAAVAEYNWTDAAVASLIKWNFIVSKKIIGSSTVKDPARTSTKLQNKYFIYWKITTDDSLGDLLDTFQWRCNNWVATDWTYCPRSFKKDWSYEKWRLNPYEAASLVVIDQNYPSNLFN